MSFFPPNKINQRRTVGASLARRWFSVILLWCFTMSGISPVVAQVKVNGNVAPNRIEIDTTANFGIQGTALNPLAAGESYIDWQKDTLANEDGPSLIGGVAIGIKTSAPDQTGAVGGTGHWYGARIVDGFANGKDTDIFLQGGKVNEPESWIVGPGSVGSSKTDATQMYMANNQNSVFFGMERSANNGTTAFDWEFNQAAPDPVPAGQPGPYIPNRTTGDKIISFDFQGSGGQSGSVAISIQNFNGTEFVPAAVPAGLFATINAQGAAAGSWGYVNAQSNWLLGNLDRRLFGEAQVPLSALPGVEGCGDSLFVQIRTRSSDTGGSDAKDTTPIFEYVFGGPSAQATLTGSCDLTLTGSSAGSKNASGGTTGLSYAWTLFKGATQVTTSTDANPVFNIADSSDAPGDYHATLVVTEGGCVSPAAESATIPVRRPLGIGASKTNEFATGNSDTDFGVSLTGTPQNVEIGDSVDYQWQQVVGGVGSDIAGKTSTTLSWSLADLIVRGAMDTNTSSILGENYLYRRYSSTYRIRATRTINGQQCPATSPDVTVRGLKAVDP